MKFLIYEGYKKKKKIGPYEKQNYHSKLKKIQLSEHNLLLLETIKTVHELTILYNKIIHKNKCLVRLWNLLNLSINEIRNGANENNIL